MRKMMLFFLCLIFSFASLLTVIRQIEFIPYNIRELINPNFPLLSAVLFIFFLILTLSFPALMANLYKNQLKLFLALPLFLIVYCVIGWGILRSAVPLESISDIVGAPILNWPWEFEYIARFIPLYMNVVFCFFNAALISSVIYFKKDKIILFKGFMVWTVIFAVGHWVIVEKAATDNLVELMDSGGSWLSSFLIIIFLFITAFSGSQLAIMITRIRPIIKFASGSLCIVLAPLAFFCLWAATEHNIKKYGTTFSALQFLLSPDRDHYVGFPELLFRYGIAYMTGIISIASMQFPVWQWVVQKNQSNN